MLGVNLLTDRITIDNPTFDLKGRINPCFQNLGESPVYVNGNLLDAGDSFPINTNGLPLQNTIDITFTDHTKSKNVVCNFLRAIEVVESCK